MATYVCLIQFTDQGIRNIKDTVKRGDAAMAEAEKMGMKIVLLPDVVLQDAGMVRQAVQDVGRRQTETLELAAEVDADHAASPRTGHRECCHRQRVHATSVPKSKTISAC